MSPFSSAPLRVAAMKEVERCRKRSARTCELAQWPYVDRRGHDRQFRQGHVGRWPFVTVRRVQRDIKGRAVPC